MTPVDATIVAGFENTEDFTGWDLADDIAGLLGITKWEPPIKSTQGDVERDMETFHRYTSIEHWRNYPDTLGEDEEVVITEKLHGTNCRLGYVRDPSTDEMVLVAGSHKTRRKGENSLYWKPFEWYHSIETMIKDISKYHNGASVVLFGEIFGSSVQDMAYGYTNGKKDFRAFDISVDGKYLDYEAKKSLFFVAGVPTVPFLYKGPARTKVIEDLTDGNSTFKTDRGFAGREGIVITPAVERDGGLLGRVIFKSVSADYLARKGGTDSH